ncbi:hypothetical protein [Solirhodobacter olei]|uniref:hypothetical protein n=1 Tax=Solirhodobacter olei TaxID=2493082 RepID=UPI000FD7154D|nr:hypothetical protein [Solirhodobacter olei]
MRNFFINSLEKVVNVFVVIAAIGIVIAAVVMVAGGGDVGPSVGARIAAALAVLVGGGLYLIVIGGLLYMGIGIYQNTKRTADALENQANR